MSTAKQKQAAKDRAAKNAAKKANSSGSKDSSKGGSFNYQALGISPDYWNKLGSEGQSAIKVLNAGIMKVIDKNQPLPEVLDKKEMDKLWKEAESDPVIQKQFGDELKVASDYMSKNIDLLSSEFQNLTGQQQRDYIEAKKNLIESQAAAGTAQSGFRGQAQAKQEADQSSVIQSTRNQLKSQLQSAESQFEQKFGTKALQDLKINPVTGKTETGYTGPGYGEAITYSPTGNLTGTQSADTLQAKLTKQQDLAAEQIQANQLENIQKEKKQAQAISKLKLQ